MTCKKCGEQINGSYTFCPKCGNKIVQKKGKWKIVVLLLLVISAICGIGYLFMLKNWKQLPVVEVENTTDKNVQIESEAVESDADINVQVEEELIVDEIDEMEEFFLSLSFVPIEMEMGETYQIQLEKKMSDAVWISSDEKIVQVTDGVIRALMPGTATITVSLEENQKYFDVVVNSFKDVTLAVNCSKTIELNDAITNVHWESSEPEIVSVSEGVINSLTSGTAVVTAYIDEVPYSFEVIATTPDISTTSVREIIGNTQQVSILGTNGIVEWKSDNTAIATVSETGVITAEPTGAGQNTVVHAYVDGMEFKVDVAVEPIPQLSSTYKIYGYQDNDTYKNAKITLCANANETGTMIEGYGITNSKAVGGGINKVLNVADGDYSDGMTYPVYRTFDNTLYSSMQSYTEIYLLGTSQKADVLLQGIDYNGEIIDSKGKILYEENDGYGVVKIYYAGVCDVQLATISVDGYTYEIIIATMGGTGYPMPQFSYSSIDMIPLDFVVEECSVDEVITHKATNSSGLVSNSRTYHTNNDWVERIGTKFVEEVEDQAIEMVAGAVLKLILPF